MCLQKLKGCVGQSITGLLPRKLKSKQVTELKEAYTFEAKSVPC